MRLYPAIDILGGNAVRLVRGDYAARRIYDEDPLAAARAWVQAGARRLHVVDLDGARGGEPVNLEHLRAIAAQSEVPVQYGGGLRSAAGVQAALTAGASRVVLGTVAFTAPELLRDVLREHGPERVLVSIDVRGGRVATHGWLESSGLEAEEAFAQLGTLGVRNFVFTNIDEDGTLAGANREQAISVTRAAGRGSVIYSGGVGTLADLEQLARLRAQHNLESLEGVIVGKALYERRFTIAEAHAALAG